ncbi:hypothetical protein V8C42DRAFT_314625 [Trichoderma barbatum]
MYMFAGCFIRLLVTFHVYMHMYTCKPNPPIIKHTLSTATVRVGYSHRNRLQHPCFCLYSRAKFAITFRLLLADFISVSQLAYQLSKMLSETKGATKEYRQLITELNVVHRVLLQVNDQRASSHLAQATVNAL